MFCEKCGYENKDDALFCENCGQQINKEETINLLESDDAEAVVATEIQETAEIQETSAAEKIEGIQETEEIRETRKYDETTEEQTTIISKNITGSSTGSYSWMYEFSLWKNPAVLMTVLKFPL